MISGKFTINNMRKSYSKKTILKWLTETVNRLDNTHQKIDHWISENDCFQGTPFNRIKSMEDMNALYYELSSISNKPEYRKEWALFNSIFHFQVETQKHYDIVSREINILINTPDKVVVNLNSEPVLV